MSPPIRSQLTALMASAQRRAAAEKARATFLGFCEHFAIPPDGDALLLHLTHLHTTGASGRQLRERLSLLNLAARLEGQPPWGHNSDVQRLLRGLHQTSPIGGAPRSLPLYREQVEALVDAIMTPTPQQLRWRAALLLANATATSARSLAHLQWDAVTITKESLQVNFPQARRRKYREPFTITRAEAPEVHQALSALKNSTLDRSRAVFAGKSSTADHHKLLAKLQGLPRWNPTTQRRPTLPTRALEPIVGEVTMPEPQQLRDRALILTSFGAALTGREALEARASCVEATDRGLLIHIPRRRHSPIGLPATKDAYCPVTAWRQWQDCVAKAGLHPHHDLPAFPLAIGSRIEDAPMTYWSLLYVIRHRCQQAAFADNYKFTSLRAGWIRSALRDGRPIHEVAAHAGFQSLDGVRVHERRETLLVRNVASQLGM